VPWLDLDDDLLATARELARLAMLAYEENERQLRIALADRFVRLQPLPLGLGFVAGSDREVVVAFAGTRDGIDWAFNIVHSLAPGYGGRVHKGFAHLADHVGDEVTRTVDQFRTSQQRLALTGHSRGGAVAVLMAQRLDAAGIEPKHVFTFGAPRVGDAAFASAYRPRLYRFEDTRDPVPTLPPFLDYEPVGEQFLLTRQGRIYRTDGSWADSLVLFSQVIEDRGAERILDCHRIDHDVKQLGG
jgi:triacylglycerol lipase